MTPDQPAKQNDQQTDLPDIQSSGVNQSVILVADDEALVRNLVTLLLQHEDYFVLC